MTGNPRRFLVFSSERVGELVMAQSLFIELKNRYPACRIDVLAPRGLFPLLERMPQVAKAIVLPDDFERFGLADRLSFAAQIRASGYSHAILLNEHWRYALVAVLARIPVRRGYAPKALLNDPRTPGKNWTTLEKFVALGTDVPGYLRDDITLPNLAVGLHNQLPVMEKFSIVESSEPVLALCPGGVARDDENWGGERYASLARDAIGQGWKVWLLGDENDRPDSWRITECVGPSEDFIGHTSLGEAIDLLSLADVVVTNYSGLMHIALALHRQVLVIADSSRIDSPACRQPGCRLLPLDAPPERLLAELTRG